MIKPASSLCDMRCSYCFYHDVAASRQMASMGVMTWGIAAALIRNVYCVLEPGDSITFAFQGGEPGLAGLGFYKFFTEEVKKCSQPGVQTGYAIQTNGLTIDDDWCSFFLENGFLIGLSLDGDASLHNQNRVDAKGKGTYNRVMNAKKLLDKHGVPYNVLCVLTAESARRARRIWDFILREKIEYIQFIPCLEALDNMPDDATGAALTGKRFYQFYSALFPLWKEEAERGNVVNIRLFEDLAGVYLAGRGITCGVSGRCSPQIVVEGDGSVYPCDFFVLDKYKVGDLSKSTLKDVFEAVVGSGFLSAVAEPPAICESCAYRQWCRGGCKRMARAVYGGGCGMKMFLDECLESLLAATRIILERQRQP